MHKQLNAAELAEVQAAYPVQQLTRAEKLNQWAALVEAHPHQLYLYSNLEQWPQRYLDDPIMAATCAPTAVSLALKHEAFRAEGIGDTVGSALKFFELTLDELHEFSCDCGGAISNANQAKRIRKIVSGSMVARAARAVADVIF